VNQTIGLRRWAATLFESQSNEFHRSDNGRRANSKQLLQWLGHDTFQRARSLKSGAPLKVKQGFPSRVALDASQTGQPNGLQLVSQMIPV
jgi:hypothetical protein